MDNQFNSRFNKKTNQPAKASQSNKFNKQSNQNNRAANQNRRKRFRGGKNQSNNCFFKDYIDNVKSFKSFDQDFGGFKRRNHFKTTDGK